MNTAYICLLIAACIAISMSSDFLVKGDPCSKFDSCYSEPPLRTCSCDSSCHVYGTCCHDIQKDKSKDAFQCYQGRAVSPIFAKRSCPDDFKGHVGDRAACLDDDQDEMDIKNNLLVTSHKTKVTYWNKKCAACNKEANEDLEYWNIEVFCPPHKDVNRKMIRRNLTFDQENKRWGLQVGDEFLNCIIKYAPPPYIDEVKHCIPNLVSSCPENYENGDVAKKCSQYYAERKLKNSETYYKNIHCAMCNDVNSKDLECPGMSNPEENVEETDFRDMIEERFTRNQWLDGKIFKCSSGYSYDPSREMCREFKEYHDDDMVMSSANSHRKYFCLMVLAVLMMMMMLY